MGKKVDIGADEYRSGDALVLRFTVADIDADPTGATAKDLTGATIVWYLCTGKGKLPALLAKALGTGIAIVGDPVNGVCDVTIDTTDTESLEGELWHELRVTDAASKRHTSAYGRFRIEPNAT